MHYHIRKLVYIRGDSKDAGMRNDKEVCMQLLESAADVVDVVDVAGPSQGPSA